MLDVTFYSATATLLNECHELSYKGGWWNCPVTGESLLPNNADPKADGMERYVVATKIALIHSEVSEALEGYRSDKMDDKLPHRKAIEVELADVIIRVGDLAGALGLDVAAAIQEKFAYNAQRADHKVENRAKKGGKKF